MGDPRNVAHAKKVSQEKHHKEKSSAKGGASASETGKKAQLAKEEQTAAEKPASPKTGEAAKTDQQPDAAQVEKSLAVLSKLKELEFHSRGNIEKLAELSLTIEEEPKHSTAEDDWDDAPFPAEHPDECDCANHDCKPIDISAGWKDDVHSEPDGEIQNNAHDGGGDS